MIGGSVINRISRVDPTMTSGIRRRFWADMKRRFEALMRNIKISIVDNNCFGIEASLVVHQPIPERAFSFERDASKLIDFMRWLESEEVQGILELITVPGLQAGAESSWANKYIDSAYLQGIRRARAELKKAGFDLSRFGTDPTSQASIVAMFHSPVHAETVAMLYTRVYEDLKTVANAMNASVRRELAEALRTGISRGFAEGKAADTIARGIVKSLNNGIKKIGMNRARTITRSEIVRAHHQSNIAEYRQMSKDLQVTVKAEFSTANDDRVCPECASLEGRKFTLDEAEGLIPVHPNCVIGQTAIAIADVLTGMSARYTGEIFKLSFSNGADLSVTSNHMLLTPHGFVMAKFLSERDTVFGGSDVESNMGDPYDDRNPARIDNIIKSLSETLGVAARTMPVTSVDFHGDGIMCEGDIDVVFADGPLRDNFNVQFREIIKQFQLDGRGIFDVLFRDGSLTEFIERTFSSSDSAMGGSRDLLAFLRGCFLKAKNVGFASISRNDAAFLESAIDYSSIASEVGRQLLNGHSGSIKFEELLDIYRESVRSLNSNFEVNASLNDSGLDGIPFGQSVDLGDLSKICTGLISPVSVERIEIFHVTNLRVYDITSTPTVYFANGILSSNCRCAAIPYIEGVTANVFNRQFSIRRAMKGAA